MTNNKYPEGPPIWAQNYRTFNRQKPIITVHRNRGEGGGGYRQHQQNNNYGSHYSNGGGGYNNRNNQSRNNRSQPTNDSMLASSLFGLTQRDLLSQNVAEWVNHELAKLSTDDLRQVEIEVKLGTIAEKKSLNRVSLPVTTECVLDPTHKDPFVCFNASVSNAYFTQTLSFLDKLIETKKKNNDSDKLETLPVQHDLDLFYDSPIDSNKIRVSLDQNNNFIEGIVKRTLASIEVYSPGDLVDFRISINLETPVAAELLQELQMSQAVPRFQREKTRLTYLQSVLKIDLTGVKMPMQQKKPIMVNGKLNKKEDESKKEIEIELNPKVVFECFQKDQENTARDDSKPKSMEILFGYLLNTTRLIIRNFSRPKDDA